jgi:hypothetical protein
MLRDCESQQGEKTLMHPLFAAFGHKNIWRGVWIGLDFLESSHLIPKSDGRRACSLENIAARDCARH